MSPRKINKIKKQTHNITMMKLPKNKAIKYSLLVGIGTLILANAWNHVVVGKCCINIIIIVIQGNFHSIVSFPHLMG